MHYVLRRLTVRLAGQRRYDAERHADRQHEAELPEQDRGVKVAHHLEAVGVGRRIFEGEGGNSFVLMKRDQRLRHGR